MRNLLGGLCCAFAFVGCAPDGAKALDGDERTVAVLPRRSFKEGTAATGTIEFSASRESIAPRRLREARTLELIAGREASLTLPLDFSTQGVFAQVTLPEPAALEVDGVQQHLGTGSLVYFPLENKTLKLRSDKSQRVVFELLGSIDSAGGGFASSDEAAQERTIAGGITRISEPALEAGVVDDTYARLTRLELRSAVATEVLVGTCTPSGLALASIDTVVNVNAGETVAVTRWLQPGAVCVQSSASAELRLKVEGRVRRFAETSLRPVTPLTVLDTATGTGGWKGRPLDGQLLDFSLASLTGLNGATHALLRVTADSPVALGTCASQGEALQPGTVTLVPVGEPLCAKPARVNDVKVTLIALVTPRSEAPGVCGARPPPENCAGATLLEKLNCLPGVTAVENDNPNLPSTLKQYVLYVTQPVDHFRPDGATFRHRALLTVRDEAGPVVLHTTGYNLFQYFSDVSRHFQTNELELEHRFFETSTPDPLDYSTLNIMQSAWDSHRFVELLSPLFTGNWVNTGHSKGGMTALYHRRFFPCDVAASAPYVMPLSLGKKDPRYGPWLAQIGGPQYENCRQTFVELDTALISRRAELAPLLQGTYRRVGNKENALWLLTGSSLWGMFQTGSQADPDQGCPAYEPLRGHPQFDEYVEQYAQYGQSFSDQYLEQGQLDSYSYQTQNELGTPGSNRGHLAQFGIPPNLPDENELVFPANMALPEFEARAMPDVQRWLSRYGEHFFFLYGGWDPWTGGKIDTAGTRDTLLYVVPEASHGVSIDDLTGTEREEAYSKLEAWLGAQRLPKRPGKRSETDLMPSYRDFMHLYPL